MAGYRGCQLWARGMLSTSEWRPKDGELDNEDFFHSMVDLLRNQDDTCAVETFEWLARHVFRTYILSVDSSGATPPRPTAGAPSAQFFLGRGRRQRNSVPFIYPGQAAPQQAGDMQRMREAPCMSHTEMEWCPRLGVGAAPGTAPHKAAADDQENTRIIFMWAPTTL
ncbi:hypothetical protein C8J57DRAFT_1483097 [Mycena rebaudengoi]|nr:hypothetical protein C8J57DRAFT_1483097 [Mycena rebaudengoi]